ncbi:uncharacterized protein LOC117562564 [Gymnodraco acuticeps]|uniref:Uncharacterized protein LOC117562564 n=1 Tax=Gymnodraco acuticeps TaxID=8218 RepID=A0A6P8WFZ3_GYMAC|nr:uncharacterized protein LOC117562564 [Gymnodraco acuticeps]
MDFDLEGFVGDPTRGKLDACSKQQLGLITGKFDVVVNKQNKKQIIKGQLLAALIDQEVLSEEEVDVPIDDETEVTQKVSDLQLQLELRKLMVREESDNRLREKEIACNLELRKYEAELRLRELELTSYQTQQLGSAQPHDFDVGKYTRFIPVFNEKDVDSYFVLFERVATTFKWPGNMWTVMLQCVLAGKAQEVYTALSEEVSRDYEQVKAAILRAYELVPEAYRQKFRGLKIQDCQAYVEFAREKEVLFERWCSSTGTTSLEDLKTLVLMEEFKNCLPYTVATYLNEQKPVKLFDAAVLADEYVLTHKTVYSERTRAQAGFVDNNIRETPVVTKVPWQSSRPRVAEEKPGEVNWGSTDRPVCHYCKKIGHIVANCYFLRDENKHVKTVALVSTSKPGSHKSELEVFAPFLMEGMVSLPGKNNRVPVTILRDTAASQSFMIRGVFPLSEESAVGSDVLVRGFGMQCVGSPLHNIHLESDLVTGPVTVGVRPCLPIEGVDLVLGNDLAGGRVLVKPGVNAVAVTRDSFTATGLDRPVRDPPSWREGGKSGTISPGAVHNPVAACVEALSSAKSDTPVTSEAPIAAETLANMESHLAHLPDAQRADVLELIVRWRSRCHTSQRNSIDTSGCIPPSKRRHWLWFWL